MATEDFTEEELKVIGELLESYVSGLASQIYGLDTLSYNKTNDLMHKREIVKDVLERIGHKVA